MLLLTCQVLSKPKLTKNKPDMTPYGNNNKQNVLPNSNLENKKLTPPKPLSKKPPKLQMDVNLKKLELKEIQL